MSGTNPSFYYGPINYSPIWFLIGLFLIGLAIGTIIIIFYVTRRKPIKTIATLDIKAPKVIDMNVLRSKYLKLIDEVEEKFHRKQLKTSECHQTLSMLVRSFYCEAMGFHAEVMTLRDLKKSNHKALAELVEQYYPDEFDKLEKGAVAQSAERARQIVREA